MKKLALTIAIVLGLGMTTFANPNGGLFQRGANDEQTSGWRDGNNSVPMLPNHGLQSNQDANGPVGSGIAVLLGLGGAYLFGKRKKEKQ